MLLKHSTFANGPRTTNLLKTANPARMSSSCAHNYCPAFESNMIARGQHEETQVPLKPHSSLYRTWDASSSIIFAPCHRRGARDQTWDPSNGVIFSRGYASIPPLKFKPSTHEQPRGVASGQLDTLALIRSAQERKARARASKLGATKTPEKLKLLAGEQNVPTVAKNIPEVAEAAGRSSQTEKTKVAKRPKIINVLPVKNVQKIEEQSNISKPSVNEKHAAQAIPTFGGPSKLSMPASATQQSTTKVTTKKRQTPIENASTSSSPEISAIPSNAALVIEQNWQLEKWRGIYQLDDRVKQRATYGDYRKLFSPLEDSTNDLIMTLTILKEFHRSKRQRYDRFWRKTMSNLEMFQSSEITGKDSPYVSILVSRISVNLHEQATLFRSLHDLKHHEEVYWSWQCRRISLDRLEFNKICHKSRCLTKEVRYRLPLSQETPVIVTSRITWLALNNRSWNVLNAVQDLRYEVNALVKWEPEDPYQKPRIPLSEPDSNGVDQRKVNALGGQSFTFIFDWLKKNDVLARRVHHDITHPNHLADRVLLGVLINEGSPGEMLQYVLTQPFLEVSTTTTGLINAFRQFRVVGLEWLRGTKNERFKKFLAWAQDGLYRTHIVSDLSFLQESFIKRVRELDHVVPASEIQRTCRTFLANMHKAERQNARERALSLRSQWKKVTAASRATGASKAKKKSSKTSKRRSVSTTNSQLATISRPKGAHSGIELSSTPSLRAPYLIILTQQARTTQVNEEIANVSPAISNGCSSQRTTKESHRGSDNNSEIPWVESNTEGDGKNPGYSSLQNSVASGNDSGEGRIIDSSSSSEEDDCSDDSSEENSSEAEEEQQEEEHVPLTYQIPTETLRIAMTASPSSGAAYWRHDLYRGPLDQKISMHYCKNMEVSERVAKYFVEEKVLGFDIEWKPNASTNDGIRDNASLIQLASEDRIALFHIALFKGNTIDELLPPTLKKIMESPDITKAGVAVRGDCTRLQKHLRIESKGMFELSHLYKLVKFSATEPKKVNKVLVSLAQQVEEHLQLPLSKGPVRESDWSKALLYEQMLYAASDAYAGFRLYDALEAKRKKLKPTPPRPEHAELNMPIRLATSTKVVTAQKSSAVVPDEDSSNAEEDFETAPEDAEESEDGIETSSTDGSSEVDDSSDAEFVPSTRRIGRVRLLSSHPAEPVSSREENQAGNGSKGDTSSKPSDSTDGEATTLTKRVGRLRLSKPSPSASKALPAEEAEKPQSPTRPKRAPKPTPVTVAPKSAEYLRAEAWVEEWRMSLPEQRKPRASAPMLKAYALWHSQSLGLGDVAAHLRDPPLAISTVSSYVLTTILLESLPFDAVRIKEPLGKLPHHVVQTRYKSIIKRMKG